MREGIVRRVARALAAGLALCCLFVFASPAGAADRFQGTYHGVYTGYNWAAGRHYCYYASYAVDGAGGISVTKYQSTQDVGTSIYSGFSTDYTQFRREGLLLGSALPYTARAHGRLRDDLEAGSSTALYTQADWYLGLFGLAHTGPDLSNSDLNGDFWTARYGYQDDGLNQAHWAGFGSERYDGAGGLTGSWDRDVQGTGLGTVPISTTYTAYGAGYVTRGSADSGFYLDGGDLLVFSDVTSSTQWKIGFSLRKPTPGTMGPGALNGSYTLAYYRYENNPWAIPPSQNYVVLLGKARFDGSGGVMVQAALNNSDGGLLTIATPVSYAVDVNGVLTLGSLIGGISPDGRTAVGVLLNTTDHTVWGIFVLVKSSGIGDSSPLCHLLGLNQ